MFCFLATKLQFFASSLCYDLKFFCYASLLHTSKQMLFLLICLFKFERSRYCLFTVAPAFKCQYCLYLVLDSSDRGCMTFAPITTLAIPYAFNNFASHRIQLLTALNSQVVYIYKYISIFIPLLCKRSVLRDAIKLSLFLVVVVLS